MFSGCDNCYIYCCRGILVYCLWRLFDVTPPPDDLICEVLLVFIRVCRRILFRMLDSGVRGTGNCYQSAYIKDKIIFISSNLAAEEQTTVNTVKSVKPVIMARCYVLSCGVVKRDAASDVLFFTFPKDPELRKFWIEFTERTDPFGMEKARICSAHFIPSIDYKNHYGDRESLPRGFRILEDGALPRRSPQQDLELIDKRMKMESDARVNLLL